VHAHTLTQHKLQIKVRQPGKSTYEFRLILIGSSNGAGVGGDSTELTSIMNDTAYDFPK
jgi:hypothetical protein